MPIYRVIAIGLLCLIAVGLCVWAGMTFVRTPAEASQVAAATLRSIGRRMEKSLAGSPKLGGYTSAHYQDLASRIRKTLEDAKL